MQYMPKIENIRQLRQNKGLSMQGLSLKAGMGVSAIYRMENEVCARTHALSATAIAAALGCEVEDIFTPINKGA